MRSCTPHAEICESLSSHYFRIIQIAAVNHDRIPEFLPKTLEVEICELLPLRKDEEGIAMTGSFIG